MHREVIELLQDARGTSEFVFCVVLDIRGFTPFSAHVESPNVAVFIKRVFLKIIADYFPDAAYVKLMGDGLMLIVPYEEKTLAETATRVVESSFRLIEDFPGFCAGDPMLNFPVPDRLGIGISRGLACRIESAGKTLDYCGRIVNLAARLMDLARPAGVVLAGDFSLGLLSESLAEKFGSENVFIKGVAEREPTPIYYTKDLTEISAFHRQPLDQTPWTVVEAEFTFQAIRDAGDRYRWNLEKRSIDPESFTLKVTYPQATKSGQHSTFVKYWMLSELVTYRLEAGKPYVVVDFAELSKRLAEENVKPRWKVQLRLMYV